MQLIFLYFAEPIPKLNQLINYNARAFLCNLTCKIMHRLRNNLLLNKITDYSQQRWHGQPFLKYGTSGPLTVTGPVSKPKTDGPARPKTVAQSHRQTFTGGLMASNFFLIMWRLSIKQKQHRNPGYPTLERFNINISVVLFFFFLSHILLFVI